LPNLKLVAICDKDRDRDREQAAASKFGMTPYTDFDEMLADSVIDIVAINTLLSCYAALIMAANSDQLL